jgi:hypothetical protein
MLSRSEAYLAGAQKLSHTGSSGGMSLRVSNSGQRKPIDLRVRSIAQPTVRLALDHPSLRSSTRPAGYGACF